MARNDEKIKPFDGPAGGWGSLRAVAKAVRGQMAVARSGEAMHRVNQPEGFDCPGCAWPDPKHTSSFEFCENGAKAVTWETTSKRVTPAFFAQHTLKDLWDWSDFQLEDEGRLSEPVKYDAAQDKFVAVTWEQAAADIGAILQSIEDPDAVEFYTSGRASNEAAFLYQLFAREYGTNNFPDCSNLCHEATSAGLPVSIGVGKGTVSLEDFDHADAVFCIGHNPGTNHPRMLSTLREVSLRGKPIVVLNPMPERGLERFISPQHPVEMLTGRPVQIASTYFKPRVGGDIAALSGIMKALFEMDAADTSRGVIDHAFIREHTVGIDALREDLESMPWSQIEDDSGLTQDEMRNAAAIYAGSDRVIVCYGMGITQHRHGVDNVQQIANFLLLRGNIGREGAGICPLRGHSNVQGDRTVGITEKPTATMLDGIQARFGFEPPRHHGHDAVATIQAIDRGESKALICLGGNLAVAVSDPQTTFSAMRKLDLAVHIATKLNRSHIIPARNAYILPCLGRTERDIQESGPQSVTVEDSMSMVHASEGRLEPASPHLKSEPAIVALLAKASLPNTKVDWDSRVANYDLIRDDIEAVFPFFENFNERIRVPGGFPLRNAARHREWNTDSGKAQFIVAPQRDENEPHQSADLLTLTTLRSHDQYNTTIYGLNDRYRGVYGQRNVVFVNPSDLDDRGLKGGDRIDVFAVSRNGSPNGREIRNFVAVPYGIARGSVAMYFPEGNGLLALDEHDTRSGTPAYKSIPIRLQAAQ